MFSSKHLPQATGQNAYCRQRIVSESHGKGLCQLGILRHRLLMASLNSEAIPVARIRISRILEDNRWVHETGNPKSSGTGINYRGLNEVMNDDYRFS